jgi:hypothetical protein
MVFSDSLWHGFILVHRRAGMMGRWVVVGWLGFVASVVDSQGALPVEIAHDGGDHLWCGKAMSEMVVQRCY